MNEFSHLFLYNDHSPLLWTPWIFDVLLPILFLLFCIPESGQSQVWAQTLLLFTAMGELSRAVPPPGDKTKANLDTSSHCCLGKGGWSAGTKLVTIRSNCSSWKVLVQALLPSLCFFRNFKVNISQLKALLSHTAQCQPNHVLGPVLPLTANTSGCFLHQKFLFLLPSHYQFPIYSVRH